jgi:hypothetical protein
LGVVGIVGGNFLFSDHIDSLSDLTQEEFAAIYLGFNGKSASSVDETVVSAASVNWVTKGAVQAVKD